VVSAWFVVGVAFTSERGFANLRIDTAVTRRAVVDMPLLAKQGRPAARRPLFPGTFKSYSRIKSLVTVAGGFAAILRPLTRWRAVWFIFSDMSDSLERLYQAVIAARDLDPSVSRTARLFRRGPDKMAKKLAEEAIEVVIDAVNGKTDAVIRESADLLYNLTVLWAAAGVRPEDVWQEMERRESLLGIAEKMPKSPVKVPARRPIVALEGRALRKRH
jgi:phosphoribosyl-ATP pyrophosphohydrolase